MGPNLLAIHPKADISRVLLQMPKEIDSLECDQSSRG